MHPSIVAFSRDPEFRPLLEALLAPNRTDLLPVAGTPEDVLHYLRTLTSPTLFIDVRPEFNDESTSQCVAAVEAEFKAGKIITVGENSYSRDTASTLDRIAMGHIRLSPEGMIGLTSERLSQILTAHHGRKFPEVQTVEAGGVSFRTATAELFPVLRDLMRVAHRNVTLLLVGETGTGKTTLARFIHNRSPRASAPFQHLACGTLPSDLIESELFGHTRGAFTGAERNKVGRFESAGRGTLLLDEIDVLDLKQQSKLLKVIETGEYELVGSTEPRKSEARLIVASNVCLDEMVEKSQFRADLYYRLNVLEFRLPPLRERPLDIAQLALDFVEECCREHATTIDRIHRDFLSAIRRYPWPGNLRELKNHMRRAVLFSENGILTVNDLAPQILQAQFQDPAIPGLQTGAEPKLAELVAQSERELVEQALKEHDYNRTRTAKVLGLSRVGLYKKLRRLGLMERA
jgi:DNA-binding NtrC family response regulator